MLTADLSNQILEVLSDYNPKMVGIFGSYARGDHHDKSDIDILIDLSQRMGLIQLIQLENNLSDRLGVKVDLVTYNSLKNPKLKKYIHQDLITIYDEKG